MINFKSHFMIALFLFSNFSYADCNRYIYNHSKSPWTVSFQSKNDCVVGSSTIYPREKMGIQYRTWCSGLVEITDKNNQSEVYRFFPTGKGCSKFYDEPDGGEPSDSISVNDPQDGGMIIKGETW